MPVYEYECPGCGLLREEFLPCIPRVVGKTRDLPCPKCQAVKPFKKVMSRTTFTLGREGVGWARDGYSRSSQDGSRIVSLTEPK